MSNDLKEYRSSELSSYVLGNILLVILFSGVLNTIQLLNSNVDAINDLCTVISSAVLISIIYIYTFLLDSLIPSHWKEKIIWFFNGGRPGDKVFTGISKNNTDDRFSAEEVSTKYEELYKAMKDSDGKARKHIENRYWYKLYKKHESHMQIMSSQRDYLLCRDMVFMTLFLLFGYILFQLFRNDIVSWKMILFFVVELIITWICACNKGKRYVLNVIALDLVDEKSETEPLESR